jgi:hypothetical protein
MKKLMLITTLMLLVFFQSAIGQTEKLKALFLLNFAKNIKWDESDASKPVTIYILGDDNVMFTELQKFAATTTVGNRSIVVSKSSVLPQAGNYCMVFICPDKSESLPELIKLNNGKPCLIVSEQKDGCQKGAGINLINKAGKLSFEINRKVLEKNGLRVSNSLLTLGVNID